MFFHEFPLSVSKLAYFKDAVIKCDFRTLLFPWYEYDLSYELSHAKDNLSKKLSGDYSADSFATETQKYHESGFIERYPVDTDSLEDDYAEEWFPEDIVEKNMNDLGKIVKLCKDNNIELIAVTTPLSDSALKESNNGNSALNEYYSDYFGKADVEYINFNYGQYYDMTEHDLTCYTDLDGHMNGDAARRFSKILADVLK